MLKNTYVVHTNMKPFQALVKHFYTFFYSTETKEYMVKLLTHLPITVDVP